MPRLLLLFALVPLTLAACGSAAQTARTGRTVTFETAGTFPPATITGTYSTRGCLDDAREIVHNARLYYVHSTSAPGPADLYYYDLRFAYAHFDADACTSSQLGDALKRGLTARQRAFLLHNVASDLLGPFRAALKAAHSP